MEQCFPCVGWPSCAIKTFSLRYVGDDYGYLIWKTRSKHTRTESSLRNYINIEEKSTTNNFDAADRAVNAGLKGVKLLAARPINAVSLSKKQVQAIVTQVWIPPLKLTESDTISRFKKATAIARNDYMPCVAFTRGAYKIMISSIDKTLKRGFDPPYH